MEGLASYIVRRLLWAPVILLAVSLATFALGRFGPGDPIQILQGQYRDPVQRERIAQELGYHDSFFVQYWRYMERAGRPLPPPLGDVPVQPAGADRHLRSRHTGGDLGGAQAGHLAGPVHDRDAGLPRLGARADHNPDPAVAVRRPGGR